jgi:hypothetical protein
LKSEAQLARDNLKDRLDMVDSKVSLALDAWHSKVGNMEFLGTSPVCLTCNYSVDSVLGITAHWIDDNFELHQEVLTFERLCDHHAGENMSNIVLEVLGHYDIADKLFCITTDNAGNNGTLCESLKKKARRTRNPLGSPGKFV